MKSISQVMHFAVLTVLALPLSSHAKQAVQTKPQKTILLAVDGFSYNALVVAKQNGLFKQFKNPSKHVAPFPSMTDLSWSEIFNTAELFGSQGRIGSVEATYFDESSQGIKGDPRDYYRRLAAPKYYMGAFDHFFNPYVEGLMYFPTEEVPRKEITTVIDELIAASDKDFISGYIGAIDSIAHTQVNRLFPVLKELDSQINRLFKEYNSKGYDLELILISDHGNIGSFNDGEIERELYPVDIENVVNKIGFNFVQQLKDNMDIAMPLMALGTWAPVYFKNTDLKRTFIDELKKTNWFDQSISICHL